MIENPTWRKSSYSGAGNNECVELLLGGTRTLVRDSKNPAAGELALAGGSYRAFVSALKTGGRPHV